MAQPNTLLEWALEYARGGIPVLPLSGKLPRIPKRHGGKGVHDSTTDTDRIRQWWRRWPNANIGLRCGIRFDVIDIDGREGRDALDRLLAAHAADPIGGPRVHTGSGGWHLYIAPTGLPDKIGVLDHVDYRAADRYVVAPPSIHPETGRRYRWIPGRGIDTPLGHLPTALRELLTPHQIERPPVPTIRPAVPGHPYGRRALEEETTAVATAPRGRRNDQLWRSARNLYTLVAGGVLDQVEVDHALRDAAEQSGLLREEARSTERTLQSARQAGMAHPRGIPASPSQRVDLQEPEATPTTDRTGLEPE
jgi:hypothetical protein